MCTSDILQIALSVCRDPLLFQNSILNPCIRFTPSGELVHQMAVCMLITKEFVSDNAFLGKMSSLMNFHIKSPLNSLMQNERTR